MQVKPRDDLYRNETPWQWMEKKGSLKGMEEKVRDTVTGQSGGIRRGAKDGIAFLLFT